MEEGFTFISFIDQHFGTLDSPRAVAGVELQLLIQSQLSPIDTSMAPTIIITGASKGIGLAATQFLLADGARVVTVQRSVSTGLTALASEYPTTLRIVQGDSTAEETIKSAVREALDSFGAVDAVVFNAATAHVGQVEDVALGDWQKTFDVNVFGVVRFLREVLPALKDGSKIVFISSVASENALLGAAPYSASKAALNSINRTVAAEHPGIVSVSLHPGNVRTELSCIPASFPTLRIGHGA